MFSRNEHSELVLNLLQAHRGRLSQRQFSTKLGFTYSAVFRWESNIKPISWEELFGLISKKTNIREISFADEFQGSIENFKDICRFLIRSNSEDMLSALLDIKSVDRRTAKNWLSGKSSPPAAMVFALFKKHSPETFSDFYAQLFPDDITDVDIENHELKEKARPFFGENVLAALLSEALNVKAVIKNGADKDALADFFDIDLSTVDVEVQRMLDLGWLVTDGDRLSVNYDKPVNLFPKMEHGLRLAHFIAQLAKQSIFRRIGQKPEDKDPNSTDYLTGWIASLSHDAAKKIHALSGEYNKKLLDILKDDLEQDKDVLKAVIFHSFDVDHRSQLKDLTDRD